MIAFLLVVSVITAGLFGLAYSGTTSLKTYRAERNLRYAADGALDYAVANVARDTTLGRTAPDAGCGWNIPIEGRVTGDDAFASGSQLRVTCEAYTASDTVDSDGGQRIRYVTFTVSCFGYAPANGNTKPACNASGGAATVVATAKVRYDIDALKPAATRAAIPKVISWDLLP